MKRPIDWPLSLKQMEDPAPVDTDTSSVKRLEEREEDIQRLSADKIKAERALQQVKQVGPHMGIVKEEIFVEKLTSLRKKY